MRGSATLSSAPNGNIAGALDPGYIEGEGSQL